ncbi:MAG: hypothetical protein JWP02_1072 [Acidimicrobiales bacterium]|nr:hypothetical protein [Acidimicrobiales bacterium]
MRTQSLFGHAVAMGVTGADIDEGAVELLALSHRDRRLVAETTQRLGYLQPGDDITLACEIVVEALRRGDASSFWLPACRADYDYSPLDLLAQAV